MKDRIPTYPGRVKLIAVDADSGIYDMERADEPIENGTPLNKRLLDFAVAANGMTSGTSTAYTLNDEFGGFELTDGAKINFRLHVDCGNNATLNVNNTGAKPLLTVRGMPLDSGLPMGVWITAIYSSAMDGYIVPMENALRPVISVVTPSGTRVQIISNGTLVTEFISCGSDNIKVSSMGLYEVHGYLDTLHTSTAVDVSSLGSFTAELSYFEPVLEDNTWEQISIAAKYFAAENLWSIGDTKTIDFNYPLYRDDGSSIFGTPIYSVYIIGFNHNSEQDDSAIGTVDFGTFLLTDTKRYYPSSQYDDWYSYSPENTTFRFSYFQPNGYGTNSEYVQGLSYYGISNNVTVRDSNNASIGMSCGWKYSDIRKNYLKSDEKVSSGSSVMARLPASLRNVLAPITVHSCCTIVYSSIYTTGLFDVDEVTGTTITTDYLPLLSMYEIFGEECIATLNSAFAGYSDITLFPILETSYQKQYEYYANSNSRVNYEFYGSNDDKSTSHNFYQKSSYNTTTMVGYINNNYINTKEGYVDSSGNPCMERYSSFSVGLAPKFRVGGRTA